MSRRELVATTALTALAAGCTTTWTDNDDRPVDGSEERAVADADRYDCDDVFRPEPVDPDHEEAPEPVPYPAYEPGSSAVRSPGAKAFAVEFERAYRRNDFLERYGEEAREINLFLNEGETEAIETGTAEEEDAVLVSLAYDLETKTVDAIGDGWNVRIVYYVDERLALRAKYDGEPEESLFDPDPRDAGTLVACFD